MLRTLLYGLAILHLGPGLAFAIVAFGCEGAAPFLGAACGKNAISSFVALTVGGWFILSAGLAAVLLWRRARHASDPSTSAVGPSPSRVR